MENVVFHGSSARDLKILKPNESTHMKDYVYATSYPMIALVFSVNNFGDFDFDLTIKDGVVIFTERRNGAFDKYNSPGFLYTLDATNFKQLEGLWEAEVVSEQEEKIISCEYVDNVFKKLKDYEKSGDMKIYRYPNKPDFIPDDDSDLVYKYVKFENMGHRGSVDNLIYYFPELKEKAFSLLNNPKCLYYISKKREVLDSIIVYDNVVDAILGCKENLFVRDNGWLSFKKEDDKIAFSQGGFNLEDEFYLYSITGDINRISTHSFEISNPKIESCEFLDLTNYYSQTHKLK